MRAPKKIIRSVVLSAALALGAAAALVTACEPHVVDVGSNDAAAPNPTPSTVDAALSRNQYGCTAYVDEEIRSLRVGACGGQCTMAPASPYDLDSKQQLIAATTGQWMFCEGTLGPPGAVGIDFAPGCRLFFLRKDGAGAIVRGTEAAYQASYDIYDPRPAGSPGRIDIHLDDASTLTFDVSAFRCPEHLQLTDPSAPGTRLELAPGFGDAGRRDPVAFVCRPRPIAL